ncbi:MULTISPECIES: anticodon nuclease [Bartonella]|uniref:anticodon nuclease n=1 Tax=Bartonella TaxID=773 RepID=UPI0018DE5692|nr:MULTISPECIES: anticodon nuclease [Bartonella]
MGEKDFFCAKGTLKNIAEGLKERCDRHKKNLKVHLIYAFNGTGKTRLSHEFEKLVPQKTERTENKIPILNYNSDFEDIFYWEKESTHKLVVQNNSFLQFIINELGEEKEIVSYFQKITNKGINVNFHINERDTKDWITFDFMTGGNDTERNIKISKGEESCFIWSIFFNYMQIAIKEKTASDNDEKTTDRFDALKYIFIDDPVSSLDQNHLIELAIELGKAIRECARIGLNVIITTHNTLFYNILYNEIKEKKSYFLTRLEDGTYELAEKKGDANNALSYHLYLKDILVRAIENRNIKKYHFMLLRNLYEKTAMFLGYESWGKILPQNKVSHYTRIMNFNSHSKLTEEEPGDLSADDIEAVGVLVKHLIHNFKFFEEKNQNEH